MPLCPHRLTTCTAWSLKTNALFARPMPAAAAGINAGKVLVPDRLPAVVPGRASKRSHPGPGARQYYIFGARASALRNAQRRFPYMLKPNGQKFFVICFVFVFCVCPLKQVIQLIEFSRLFVCWVLHYYLLVYKQFKQSAYPAELLVTIQTQLCEDCVQKRKVQVVCICMFCVCAYVNE